MKNKKTIKVAVRNYELWTFFKKQHSTFQEYYDFMYPILKQKKVFNRLSFSLAVYLPYFDCTPKKRNQKILQQGEKAAEKYITERTHVSASAGQIYYIGDIVYQLWEWGIGMKLSEYMVPYRVYTCNSPMNILDR